MKRIVLMAGLLLAFPALAQSPAADMVMLPRNVAIAAMNWITQPDATIAVKLYAALSACIQDNPQNGHLMRIGEDQCPEVTAALAARDKEITDLQKKLTDASAAKSATENK